MPDAPSRSLGAVRRATTCMAPTITAPSRVFRAGVAGARLASKDYPAYSAPMVTVIKGGEEMKISNRAGASDGGDLTSRVGREQCSISIDALGDAPSVSTSIRRRSRKNPV